MRVLLVFCLISITSICFSQDSYYGDKIDKSEVFKSIDNGALASEGVQHIKLKGEIMATCAAKGCWMTMKLEDGKELRITFKDYGFFVPTSGVEGNQAIVEGQIKKEITDIETLRHYAKDAGKTDEEILSIDKPKEEYSLVANGVIIEMKGE